ncbi:MAG: c-type cytochrome [Thiotrichaceae bacterium]
MKLFSRGAILKTGLVSSLAIVLSLTTAYAADEKKKPAVMTGASTSMIGDTCAGCHGMKGVSAGPSIPSLAGMSSAYLVETMEGYKSGDIPSTIMGRLAKGYTSDEFAQMGEYFSKLTFAAAAQESDSAKAEEGAKLHEKYCEKCHSESGTVAEDDAGMLKGQWKEYLAAQLMDYQNKDRKAPKKMKKKLKKLHKKHGPAGIEALIEYYSSK